MNADGSAARRANDAPPAIGEFESATSAPAIRPRSAPDYNQRRKSAGASKCDAKHAIELNLLFDGMRYNRSPRPMGTQKLFMAHTLPQVSGRHSEFPRYRRREAIDSLSYLA